MMSWNLVCASLCEFIAFWRVRGIVIALVLLGVFAPLPSVYAGPSEVGFIRTLEGSWTGQGRAATPQGEVAVVCEVRGQLGRGTRINLRASCRAQGQTGRIDMSLYFSDMTQQFHGELTSPLNYIRGNLIGRLSRGDLFLRLSAADGSEGRLLLVSQGSNAVRLLVTTIVEGANVTVFDLPLSRAG